MRAATKKSGDPKTTNTYKYELLMNKRKHYTLLIFTFNNAKWTWSDKGRMRNQLKFKELQTQTQKEQIAVINIHKQTQYTKPQLNKE